MYCGTLTPASCFTFNGCLDLSLLHTPVDELRVLQACKNKLCDPQRHGFDFKQILFQSMLTLLSYLRAKKCGRTDRQTAFQLYIVSNSYSFAIRKFINFENI